MKISELLNDIEPLAVPKPAGEVSCERVKEITMKKIKNETEKRIRRPMRLILAAALCVVLVVGAIGAIGGRFSAPDSQSRSDFFSGAFGTGIAGRDAYTWTDTLPDGTVFKEEYYPGVERVAVDQEQAARLLGDYVCEIDQGVTMDDFTIVVRNLVLDENGIGVVSYEISNPNGLNCDGSGNAIDVAMPRVGVTAETADGKMVDMNALRQEGYTDTQATFVGYLAPFYAYNGEALTLTVHYFDGEEMYDLPLPVSVEKFVPVTAFGEASISPLGMVLSGDYAENLRIHYTDGTEYVVKSDTLYNAAVEALISDENDTVFTFNRLVEVKNISSITYVDGNTGETVMLTR